MGCAGAMYFFWQFYFGGFLKIIIFASNFVILFDFFLNFHKKNLLIIFPKEIGNFKRIFENSQKNSKQCFEKSKN